MQPSVRTNFEEKVSYYARALPRMTVLERGSFLAVDCGLPSDTYNVIVVRDLADPTRLLNRGVAHFTAKRFPVAVWYWEQAHDKAGVEAVLAHGLTHAETNVAMVAELGASNLPVSAPDGPRSDLSPVEGLTIIHADSPHEIQRYGAFIARLFGAAEGSAIKAYFDRLSAQPLRRFPAMRHYLGAFQNEVVASGLLFIGSETVGIYDMVTHPDYRRRGIGSAMLAHLLHEARSYRRRYTVLQASADGMGIYLKAGFVPGGNVLVFESRT